MKRNCDYLLFDVSNILYRTFYACSKNEDVATITGLATHTALVTLNKYFRTYAPKKKIIMCFDRPSWRKTYTVSEQCISRKVYKGHRRQNLTPSEQQKYYKFLEHLVDFELIMRNYTSIITLAKDQLEADDLIAGAIQVLSAKEPNATFVIISSDKDLIQLLGDPNVQLVNPATEKNYSLTEWGNDAELFLFEKCIRGDTGDNVQSARPRCRKTKIMEAWGDPYVRTNLMKETWTNQENREMLVQDLYEENRLLMDLRCQPDDIKKLIVKTVLEGINSPGTFSFFQFMRFIGQFELKRVSDQIDQFIPMLSK